MQFPFSKPRPKPSPPNPIAALHAHFTSLLTAISATTNPLSAAVGNALQSAAAHLAPPPARAHASPLGTTTPSSPAAHRLDLAMSTESIAERLAGVPVYALSNSDEEFVLVSGARTRRALGLFCFKKDDAEALLEQVKVLDPGSRNGSKIVELALDKVFHLKVDGVAFRFIPDSCQVANAIKERGKTGDSMGDFFGVPVFQSRSLVLRSQKRKYRPVFFSKEDLEESLNRASREQRKLNPSLKGDIQVGVLEEIIEAMKGSSASEWDDVVFIPPGFDVPEGIREGAPIVNS